MAKFLLTSKKAFILFISITVILLAQAVWWIALMAKLFNEKVEIVTELGADAEYVAVIHQEEISRQIMIGFEGIFFLVLVGAGAWLIYRTLVKNEELQFAQQNFLMSVTHELKTPLASMKIYLDTLNSDKIPQEKKLTIIPRLKDDVNRLERLVENILEAGRFEKSGYELHNDYFDLIALIQSDLEKLKKFSLTHQLEITTENFPEQYIFYGDRFALSRAFEAIIENSLKYNDKDIIKLHITFKADSRSVQISIQDNGVGLEGSDKDRIFDRFYRVGEVLHISKPGSGLGLYLCREIVKAHKGTIEAESEGLGKGVNFKIHLKVIKNHENNTLS